MRAGYTIDCTGDVVTGDEIEFEFREWERVKLNRYGRIGWRFGGPETLRGRVVNDSYGRAKQQHTFTLELEDGSIRLIKGRVLYRFWVRRKKWKDESAREAALAEKHLRGDSAREARAIRKMAVGF